uniref:Myosin XI B isoform 2 n=1 Tax=Populus tomentosa TaxID=118781 RepID=A0A172CF29_POPTO|nr:Myosin XI B isoform 2 [Populus tomentosa]
MFPRLTHETFAEKLYQTFKDHKRFSKPKLARIDFTICHYAGDVKKLYQTFKDHKRFSKPKLARIDFTICHYAGDVTYQTEPFLDKSKDYVVAEHQALLSESKCSFVSGLFPPLLEESAKSSKFSSIGSRYKSVYVLGVMEAIRISCAGYPTRKTFDDFACCFAILAPDVLHGSCDEVSACKRLLEKANLEEVPVIDNELVNKLTAENEMLKDLASKNEGEIRKIFLFEAMVSSMEKKIDETEKKYEETNKLSEERPKQALDAESKIIELKTTMQRLEEKLSDLEAEDQVLQHQALFSSSSRKMSEHLEITSLIERLDESVDALIRCVEQNPGFSRGKPVGAFTIYRCLVHWRLFEAERTRVFDCLIQITGSAMENQDDSNHMAYWLSNTSILLFLLQRTLKGSGANPNLPPPPTSFFGRMAKLTAYVERMYGISRDNLKKDLSPFLSSCIQAPRASKETALKSSRSFSHSHPVDYWHNIVESLDGLLCTLKENFVPPILAQKLFIQIFSYINVQLFNSFLLRLECCTLSNGEYVKAELAELELWCGHAKEEYVGLYWDELKHTRQAVGFLAWFFLLMLLIF